MFYVLNKENLAIVEMIRETTEQTNNFTNKKYKDMYKNYDENLHIVVQKEESLPNVWEYLEDGSLVISTPYEKYLRGTYTLQEGEVVENESIVKVYKPSEYHTWNYSTQTYELTDFEGYRKLMIEQSAEEKGYSQDGVVLQNEMFDNLSADYNTTMLSRAISRYSTGRKTTWYNLDGTPIVLTAENIDKLKELEALAVSDHTQKCFDTRYAQYIEIVNLSDEELSEYDVTKRWGEIYNSINYDL